MLTIIKLVLHKKMIVLHCVLTDDSLAPSAKLYWPCIEPKDCDFALKAII